MIYEASIKYSSQIKRFVWKLINELIDIFKNIGHDQTLSIIYVCHHNFVASLKLSAFFDVEKLTAEKQTETFKKMKHKFV